MSTLYPGALDALPEDIQPETLWDAPGLEHDVMHNRLSAAVNAIQALLGTGAPAETVLARLLALETGGGGVIPSVINAAVYVGNGPPAFSLPVAPTPGNTLLVLCTRYDQSGVALRAPWAYLHNGATTGTNDYVHALSRPVIAGDGTSISGLWAGGGSGGVNRGCSCVLFELSADAFMPGAQWASTPEGVRSSLTQTLSVPAVPTLLLTMFATTQASDLSSTPANATEVSSGTGVSTSGSPRGIRAFSSMTRGSGVAAVTVSWPGSYKTYGIAVAIPSSAGFSVEPT